MIKNILAFIFSAVLIDFDRKFVTSTESEDWLFDTWCNLASPDPNLGDISVSLAKGQLAGAVIILVSSLVFVGIYIYVYIRALYDDRGMSNNTFPIGGQPVQLPRPQDAMRVDDNSRTIICPRCGASVEISARF
jgi:hypothetical protein